MKNQSFIRKNGAIIISVLIFLLILLSIAGEVQAGPFVEIGAGKNQSFGNKAYEWNDNNSVGAFIGIGYQWREQWWLLGGEPSLQWNHLSHWNSGPPFTDESESSADFIGAKVRWEFFK